MTESRTTAQGFTIYRASEALDITEAGCITPAPMSGVQMDGMRQIMQAGYHDGYEVKVLCNIPGFSLVYSWFKPGFPLPLHSHDADCLYYIVAGSLRLGTEELGPRDSFFVPNGVPYTYKMGAEGVEILEFRHETSFNFLNLAKGAAYWDKTVQVVAAHHDEWKDAKRPLLNA